MIGQIGKGISEDGLLIFKGLADNFSLVMLMQPSEYIYIYIYMMFIQPKKKVHLWKTDAGADSDQ